MKIAEIHKKASYGCPPINEMRHKILIMQELMPQIKLHLQNYKYIRNKDGDPMANINVLLKRLEGWENE